MIPVTILFSLQIETCTVEQLERKSGRHQKTNQRKFYVSRAYNRKHFIPLKNTDISEKNVMQSKESKLRRQSMPAHISLCDNIQPFTRRSLNGINIKGDDSDTSMSPVIPMQTQVDKKRKYYQYFSVRIF